MLNVECSRPGLGRSRSRVIAQEPGEENGNPGANEERARPRIGGKPDDPWQDDKDN